MATDEWIILDTETTGLVQPIYVVELAAQRMRGWDAVGEPFRMFLDHDVDIPPAAEAVHGYSRRYLSDHGQPPAQVHQEFARYVDGRPLVAFNLAYDYDQVLLPEWKRLGMAPPSPRGFCAMRLTQKLISPSPAGNYRLQTLREHYSLEERQAHSALGDVQTVIDLVQRVLRPLAEAKGASPYQSLEDYATGHWYPEILPFGKFKGHSFREAAADSDVRGWLEWLSRRPDEDTARMGKWYLEQL